MSNTDTVTRDNWKSVEPVVDILHEISQLSESMVGLCKEILSARRGKLYATDMFITSAANRIISSCKGFLLMIEYDNYLCAGAIVRMQLDNCLRLYATVLVNDVEEFCKKVLDGQRIDKLVSKDGKKLTDRFLCDELSRIYPKVKDIYEHSSGYIHLSKNHYDAIHDDGQIAIGPRSPGTGVSNWVHAISAFLMVTRITTTQVELHRDWKTGCTSSNSKDQ